jgi:hypothetical protein
MSMDRESEVLLATSIREVLVSRGQDVAKLLDELGWEDAVAADPAAATAILFREQGRALARTSLLDRVLIAQLQADAPGRIDAVCYPLPSAGDEPGPAGAGPAGMLLALPDPSASVLVVFASPRGGCDIGLVAAGDLNLVALTSIDDDLQWFSVTGDVPAQLVPTEKWPAAVAAAHRALAAEILGTGSEVMRLAVEHTSARKQYGAPIAAFQSVRHRLAEAQVHLTGAEALLESAFIEGSPIAASAAKAAAGRAHERASAAAVQVCGAIGASLEHPLHRFVNRGIALDGLLGAHRDLTARLGSYVLDTGETPLLVEV